MTTLLAVDIGGTKCAVSLGVVEGGVARVLEKAVLLTPADPEQAIAMLIQAAHDVWKKQGQPPLEAGGSVAGMRQNSEHRLSIAYDLL